MNEDTTCPHLRIASHLVRHANGYETSEWHCEDCELRFLPITAEHWARMALLTDPTIHADDYWDAVADDDARLAREPDDGAE